MINIDFRLKTKNLKVILKNSEELATRLKKIKLAIRNQLELNWVYKTIKHFNWIN